MRNSHIDVMGTSGAPQLVQSVLPKTRGILSSIMMISQALWIEVRIKLAILDGKVGHMEGGMRLWIDTKFEN